ncbi:MAG: hypothetical protein FJ295_19465 [Planctomycetes bacterium]|nr:hypothetical protein [Planctomycetota bacterium]
MTCPAGQLLDQFLDGELPSAACRELRRHVNECTDCRRAWETGRALRDRLELDPRTAVPTDLTARIMARAGNESAILVRSQSALPAEMPIPVGSRFRRWTQTPSSLASLIALAIVGLVLGAVMSMGLRRESRMGASESLARESAIFVFYGLGTTNRSSPVSLTDAYVTLVSGEAIGKRSALTPVKELGESP